MRAAKYGRPALLESKRTRCIFPRVVLQVYLCNWHGTSPSPEDSSEPAIPDGARVAIKLIQPAKHWMRPFEEITRVEYFNVARELGPESVGVLGLHTVAEQRAQRRRRPARPDGPAQQAWLYTAIRRPYIWHNAAGPVWWHTYRFKPAETPTCCPLVLILQATSWRSSCVSSSTSWWV